MNRIVTLFLFFSCQLMANADINPKGDDAILYLSQASVACAALQEVNVAAVDKSKDTYLSDGIALYKFYHDTDYETAKSHSLGMYKIITSEPAIKAQALRSLKGAKFYLSQFLAKTDANECGQVNLHANKILAIYGKKL